jgi:hypothetical protein
MIKCVFCFFVFLGIYILTMSDEVSASVTSIYDAGVSEEVVRMKVMLGYLFATRRSLIDDLGG